MLRSLRKQVRRELLAERTKHKAWKLLCQIPSIGPIRAAQLIAILQTPYRFRTKRQLWAYGGLAIETRSSADHSYVDGQSRAAKKQVSLRGLNRNHNHELKNIFKGAAIIAATKPGDLALGGVTCAFVYDLSVSNNMSLPRCLVSEAENDTEPVKSVIRPMPEYLVLDVQITISAQRPEEEDIELWLNLEWQELHR